MIKALVFELGKVETLAIRKLMLGHLNTIDPQLGKGVADGLGMSGQADAVTPARKPLDLDPSPALRLYRTPPTLAGRKVGVLVGAGFLTQGF